MPRTKFIFCHYRIAVGDDELDANAQSQFFAENQGQRVAHGREREGIQPNALIMTPATGDIDGADLISFSVGYRAGYRIIQTYDARSQQIGRRLEPDEHIKSSLVVALPQLRVIAFEDKSGDANVPARTAISGLRSVINAATQGEGVLDVIHATDADVRKALDEWELTEYLYTVRPLNPIPGSDRARRRSDAYKSENVAKETGRLWPREGETMKANDGPIAETQDLVNVGYGQNGLRGYTPEGHLAHIPKPSFHMEREKNLKEREKPRYIRIEIETEEGANDVVPTVAKALKGFFG
jgi:hypothetical protein